MHPIINAFQGYHELVKAYDESDSIVVKGYLARLGKARDEWILEVMASCQPPKFLVGFLMGANCKVYMVWLWDVNHDYAANYWVEDGSCSAGSI